MYHSRCAKALCNVIASSAYDCSRRCPNGLDSWVSSLVVITRVEVSKLSPGLYQATAHAAAKLHMYHSQCDKGLCNVIANNAYDCSDERLHRATAGAFHVCRE